MASLRDLVLQYDPRVPIEDAWLPPSQWYTDPRFNDLDRNAVLRRNWICAAPIDFFTETGDYLAGGMLDMPWLLVRGADGVVRGFWNVCRHHAARLLDGRGCVDAVQCPYHGWTYRLDGGLHFARQIAGIRGFDRGRFGLHEIPVTIWGRYVFVWLGDGPPTGPLPADLLAMTDAMGWRDLHFHVRREFFVDCDWKVFIDNYLDGGYHIEIAHPGLDGELDPAAYTTTTYSTFSVQRSHGRTSDTAAANSRIAGDAFYAWLYPTLCINRYGDMMDINIIEPVERNRIRVIFDYFFAEPPEFTDPDLLEDALAQSEQIQDEDAALCERVQQGKASPGYTRGRYVPRLEVAEQHFHRLLASDYAAVLRSARQSGAHHVASTTLHGNDAPG